MIIILFISVLVSMMTSLIVLEWYKSFMNKWLESFFEREAKKVEELLNIKDRHYKS